MLSFSKNKLRQFTVKVFLKKNKPEASQGIKKSQVKYPHNLKPMHFSQAVYPRLTDLQISIFNLSPRNP